MKYNTKLKFDCIGLNAKVPPALIKTLGNACLPGDEWKNKIGRTKSHPGRGVIYVGHLPHGFYEEALHDYFSQFGEITRLSVARSRKTGNPRGFAFLEFYYKEVAEIAASTMNNYMMFNKLLKCEFVPFSKLKGNMFIDSEAMRLNWPKKIQRKKAMLEHNRRKPDFMVEKSNENRIQKLFRVKKKLRLFGVDYDIASIIACTGKKQGITKKEDDEKVTVCAAKEEVAGSSANNSAGSSADNSAGISANNSAGSSANNSAGSSANNSPHKVHVLEIHDSEEEIDFRTPPGTVKRRLLSTSKIDDLDESVTETKMKRLQKNEKEVLNEAGMEKKKIQKKTKKLSKKKSSCPEDTEKKVTKIKARKVNTKVKGKITRV